MAFWIKPDRSDSEYELPGYRLFRKDRKCNHDRVAVFVHDDLVATRRDDLELDIVEGMWPETAVPKSRSFLVRNFYRPDRTSPYYEKDFMVKLNSILDIASSEGKEVLLFGDFNCCFMSSHRNGADCKQLKSLFRSLKYEAANQSANKSLIDLVAVNCPQNVCESGVVSTHLSDHELVYCVLKLNWKRAPSQVKTFRCYAHFNVDAFRKDLKGVNWNSAPGSDEPVIVYKLWHDFKREFITIADSHAPLLQRRVRGIDNCLWLNTSIKATMRQRD